MVTDEKAAAPDLAAELIRVRQERDELAAKLEASDEHRQQMINLSGQECACGYDFPDDVCLGHKPMFDRLRQERDELREVAERNLAWLNRWASHVATCKGGDLCSCGLTAMRHETRATLAKWGA